MASVLGAGAVFEELSLGAKIQATSRMAKAIMAAMTIGGCSLSI